MRDSWLAMGFIALSAMSAAACAQEQKDLSPHRVEFVTVEPGVRLEVLDWGGPKAGAERPLVFLAGLGSTAHVFDGFAPQFTAHHHVYAITRRGFGASSRPEPTVENYSADRLGDDVVAVIDALHLERPVLAGHSIAGEELTDVGNRYPQKVAGLIYLDAAFGPGYYTSAASDWVVSMADLWNRLEALRKGAELNVAFAQGMQRSAAQFSEDAQQLAKRMAERPGSLPTPSPVTLAIMFGEREFTRIGAPAMAIFACPHSLAAMPWGRAGMTAAEQRALGAEDAARCSAQAQAFEQANPADPVVRIAHADHFLFRSNPEVVARAMQDFMGQVK